MPGENIETVRRFFDAVRTREYEVAAAVLHPDAEWHNTAAFPGPRTVHGAEVIAGFLEDMFRSYGGTGDSGMEIEEFAEGDGVVVIHVHGWWRSERGGVPLDMSWAQIVRLAGGRIARVDVYGDYTRALKAAGLRG
jgi:ketosteroid isomerase-like protein